MKNPLLLPPLDIDGVRNGDWNQLADTLQQISDAYNQQALQLARRIGSWQTVPYDAANFTATSGVWTVDPNSMLLEYLVVDDVMFVHGSLQGTSLSADSNDLYIAIPGGYLPLPGLLQAGSLAYIQDAPSVRGIGMCFAIGGSPVIWLERWTATDWLAVSIQISVHFSLWFHVASPSGH